MQLGFSWTRDRTHVPYTGRQILHHQGRPRSCAFLIHLGLISPQESEKSLVFQICIHVVTHLPPGYTFIMFSRSLINTDSNEKTPTDSSLLLRLV